MNHLRSVFTGRYEVMGNPRYADCVQAHSFGTGSVNLEFADLAINYSHDVLRIMGDQNMAEPLRSLGARHTAIVGGSIGEGILDERPGTWGALEEMLDVMAEHDLHNPLMLGHARHIGRVVLQARKVADNRGYEINPIVPAGLPRHFNHDSKQLWTKYLVFWAPYEFAAAIKLKRDGQL